MTDRAALATRRAEKRLAGRLAAAAGLAASSPLLLACAIAVKVSSRGTILFRANRVGQHGATFTILKFRTMHQQPESAAARITGSRDTRVFPAGRLMRACKVDELPQLVNILRGEMAIVGPRPEDPTIVVERYTRLMRETLAVPPGLTSPGSLDYYTQEATLPDDPAEAERIYLLDLLPRKIALDLVYVRNRSWRYDVELGIRTVLSLLRIPGPFARRRAWERTEASVILSRDVPDRWHSAESV